MLTSWRPLFRCQFASLYEPIYSRRAAIIAGSAEPTAEEIEAGQAADSDCDDSDCESSHGKITEIKEGGDAKADAVKGIPEFWLTALKNSRSIVELITEADEAVRPPCSNSTRRTRADPLRLAARCNRPSPACSTSSCHTCPTTSPASS
jgi:hypothetical protein